MSELGAGTRGASLGFDALWVASLASKPQFFDSPIIEIEHTNDQLMRPFDDPTAKYLNGIEQNYKCTAKALKQVIDNEQFPLIISAAHSTAGGTLKGLAEAYPDQRIGVLWIDAHADIHSPYTTPSGNVHGMPLATALKLDETNTEFVRNKNVSEETKAIWSSICGENPRIQAQDLIYFAVRDTEIEEDLMMEKLGLKNYTVEEIRRRGQKACAQEALSQLEDCDILYISFDVDSMDSAISEGTGTPVLNGLTRVEVEKLMYYFFQSQKVACFEMVEINPTLDKKGNVMAETAFGILDYVYQQIQTN